MNCSNLMYAMNEASSFPALLSNPSSVSKPLGASPNSHRFHFPKVSFLTDEQCCRQGSRSVLPPCFLLCISAGNEKGTPEPGYLISSGQHILNTSKSNAREVHLRDPQALTARLSRVSHERKDFVRPCGLPDSSSHSKGSQGKVGRSGSCRR